VIDKIVEVKILGAFDMIFQKCYSWAVSRLSPKVAGYLQNLDFSELGLKFFS